MMEEDEEEEEDAIVLVKDGKSLLQTDLDTRFINLGKKGRKGKLSSSTREKGKFSKSVSFKI